MISPQLAHGNIRASLEKVLLTLGSTRKGFWAAGNSLGKVRQFPPKPNAILLMRKIKACSTKSQSERFPETFESEWRVLVHPARIQYNLHEWGRQASTGV